MKPRIKGRKNCPLKHFGFPQADVVIREYGGESDCG
jgi:hypothetical protein